MGENKGDNPGSNKHPLLDKVSKPTTSAGVFLRKEENKRLVYIR